MLAFAYIHAYIHTYTRACVPRTLFPMIFFRPPPVCVPRVFVLFPSLFFSLNFLVAMRTVAMQENDVSSSTRVRGCLPVVFKSTLGTQQLQLKKKKGVALRATLLIGFSDVGDLASFCEQRLLNSFFFFFCVCVCIGERSFSSFYSSHLPFYFSLFLLLSVFPFSLGSAATFTPPLPSSCPCAVFSAAQRSCTA